MNPLIVTYSDYTASSNLPINPRFEPNNRQTRKRKYKTEVHKDSPLVLYETEDKFAARSPCVIAADVKTHTDTKSNSRIHNSQPPKEKHPRVPTKPNRNWDFKISYERPRFNWLYINNQPEEHFRGKKTKEPHVVSENVKTLKEFFSKQTTFEDQLRQEFLNEQAQSKKIKRSQPKLHTIEEIPYSKAPIKERKLPVKENISKAQKAKKEVPQQTKNARIIEEQQNKPQSHLKNTRFDLKESQNEHLNRDTDWDRSRHMFYGYDSQRYSPDRPSKLSKIYNVPREKEESRFIEEERRYSRDPFFDDQRFRSEYDHNFGRDRGQSRKSLQRDSINYRYPDEFEDNRYYMDRPYTRQISNKRAKTPYTRGNYYEENEFPYKGRAESSYRRRGEGSFYQRRDEDYAYGKRGEGSFYPGRDEDYAYGKRGEGSFYPGRDEDYAYRKRSEKSPYRTRGDSPDRRRREFSPDRRRESSPYRRARESSPYRRARESSPNRRVREASPDRRVREASPDRRRRESSPDRRMREHEFGDRPMDQHRGDSYRRMEHSKQFPARKSGHRTTRSPNRREDEFAFRREASYGYDEAEYRDLPNTHRNIATRSQKRMQRPAERRGKRMKHSRSVDLDRKPSKKVIVQKEESSDEEYKDWLIEKVKQQKRNKYKELYGQYQDYQETVDKRKGLSQPKETIKIQCEEGKRTIIQEDSDKIIEKKTKAPPQEPESEKYNMDSVFNSLLINNQANREDPDPDIKIYKKDQAFTTLSKPFEIENLKEKDLVEIIKEEKEVPKQASSAIDPIEKYFTETEGFYTSEYKSQFGFTANCQKLLTGKKNKQ